MRLRLFKITIPVALSGICGAVCSADEVHLNDGSLLRGKISKISEGTLVMEPAFTKSEVQISMEDVENFSVDEPIFITTTSGAVFRGNIVPGTGKALEVSSSYGVSKVEISEVSELWRLGDPSPLERALKEKERRWHFTLEAGLTGQTGTNDAVQALLGFMALNTGEFDVLKLVADFNYSKTNSDKSQDNLHLIADYNDKFHAPLQWYARMDNGYDKVAKRDFFSTSAIGIGWGFIDKKDWELNLRLGAGFRYEAYQGDAEIDDVSTPTLDVGINHRFEAGFGKICNELNYSPAIDDFTGNYSITHESYFETVYYEDRVGIRIGATNSYKSIVAEGNEYLESTFYVKLVFKLK